MSDRKLSVLITYTDNEGQRCVERVSTALAARLIRAGVARLTAPDPAAKREV